MVAAGTVMTALRASAALLMPNTWRLSFTSALPDWPT